MLGERENQAQEDSELLLFSDPRVDRKSQTNAVAESKSLKFECIPAMEHIKYPEKIGRTEMERERVADM